MPLCSNRTRSGAGQGFAARELGISGEEMDARILALVALLPDLPARLALMKSSDVSRCGAHMRDPTSRYYSCMPALPVLTA